MDWVKGGGGGGEVRSKYKVGRVVVVSYPDPNVRNDDIA